MDAIKTVGLTKKYGDLVAVDHLDLQIRQGELYSLLGINGAGKTTTIKMLSCLTRPTAVSCGETAVAPGLSVRENLELICGIYGLRGEEREKRIEELSHLLGLQAVEQKKAGKLSGGWQRRLSIAMALISRPQILFLDEPTLGLDVIGRSDLWDIIRGLKGQVTIILTTHYMEEAEALSDRIGIMKDGKLLYCGTAGEIKEKAGTDNFEQAFVRIVRGMRV